MVKPFSNEEKEYIEKEYNRLFGKNNIDDSLKEKYKMILQNVFNYNKYVEFEENCKIINSINELEEVKSHFKAIVMKSDMNNLREGMILDIYKLNELYKKDYEETKNNRKIREWRDGSKFLINPFNNVQILIVLEKDENVFFADKFDFCERTELKCDFYEALNYHYVPEVIKEINKAIKLDKIEFKNNKKFNFYMCNGHTFENIKNKSVQELDYEKCHDLAVIENREMNISAYLGVYDNEFELTYSVHSKSDFDSNLENIEAELIDMSKINTEKELKDTMIAMTKNYFKGKDKLIETLSNRLSEDYAKDTIYKIETNIPGAAKIELVRVLTQALNLVTVESIKDGYVFTYEKNFFNENAEVATEEDIENYEFELNAEESEVL